MPSMTESFDYIVVGGGTAGCVIAARLSEDNGSRVLLVEAGVARTSAAEAAPPAWPTLLQTSANWGDVTVPQRATGTRIPIANGRALGGGSAINAMNYVRGHRTSYDTWAKTGLTAWGFEGLLPYFMRSESTVGRDPALRGTGGPLRVGPPCSPHPVVAVMLEAAAESGYPLAVDISGGAEEGFGWSDLNIVDGKRQSAADAYVAPAMARRNLTVVTEALVHRLRISGGRCTGVEYSTGNGTVSVDCAGEVVLAAGSIGSPQLLMLSGVGPTRHLRQTGVDVVVDLPGVGENLHDHPMSDVVYRATRRVPAGLNNHGEAFGLVRSWPGLDGPDLQILFLDVPGHIPDADTPEMGQGYTIAVAPMLPRSRGTVRLASADPGVRPLVDPNYFSDDRDLEVVVRGLRLAREIGEAHALGGWREGEAQPGPRVTSDAELRQYVLKTLTTYNHPVGTCRMGVDPQAVVDDKLRVRGVEGLRVADASVIPSIPSANTNATVCAIAERAAELLQH
ncbi:GMC family oxidoreductase N-terminal domain-containing protein [Streptomyces sp. NBC_01527]|uniref:GMC family oxidoreductase n=1 Tax=Streptomyces sp. NBC_01230 TaxID=2903784 RepID=UPI003FA3ACE8|nr:GMC family oxidoreductase N-terminal domain-containing protein [Streptomyces sp. NBC_01230]